MTEYTQKRQTAGTHYTVSENESVTLSGTQPRHQHTKSTKQ